MSYRLWLKAFTWKNEGSPSQQLSLMTDVSGPASPLITNLTCEDARTLHLEWVSPRSQDRLSFYTVYYAHGDEIQTVEMEVKNTTGNTNMVSLFQKKLNSPWVFLSHNQWYLMPHDLDLLTGCFQTLC